MQAFLVSNPASADSGKPHPVKSPSTTLTKQLDNILVHLDFGRPLKSEDLAVTCLRQRAYTLFEPSDLTFMPLAYPESFRSYFHLALNDSWSTECTIAFAQISCQVGQLPANPLCPEDHLLKINQSTEAVKNFLKAVCKQLFTHFRYWVDYHKAMTSSVEFGDSPTQAAIRIAAKKSTQEELAQIMMEIMRKSQARHREVHSFPTAHLG